MGREGCEQESERASKSGAREKGENKQTVILSQLPLSAWEWPRVQSGVC